MKLTTEKWKGVKLDISEVANASWNQVETALRALDQKKHTQVLLGDSETSLMAIGGGLERFHLEVGVENETFFLVDNPSRGSGVESLVVGGQRADYPSRNIVDLATALRVAKIFFENGQLDATLNWVRSELSG